jgi:RNA polymerase sigma-70 factor (ECF subfamily)
LSKYEKHNKVFTEKIVFAIKQPEAPMQEIDIDLSTKNINNSQLQMMFAICYPGISPEAQIGLSLSILCGFGVEEIADAFLSNKETIYKRLARAK